MLSMDSEDVGTRLYNPLFPTHCSSRCLLEWQKNLLEKQMVFIGQFDHLDAPICKMARLLDIDIVFFQHEQGANYANTEILDTRKDTYKHTTEEISDVYMPPGAIHVVPSRIMRRNDIQQRKVQLNRNV